jgi:hypothetical protein
MAVTKDEHPGNVAGPVARTDADARDADGAENPSRPITRSDKEKLA